jgi:hypothetical protein
MEYDHWHRERRGRQQFRRVRDVPRDLQHESLRAIHRSERFPQSSGPFAPSKFLNMARIPRRGLR